MDWKVFVITMIFPFYVYSLTESLMWTDITDIIYQRMHATI